MTGAEAMVRLLEAHGVDTVFGLCGDTSLPFYDALYRIGGSIRHVLTRDERSAGYMADVYARVTNKIGVCEGPSGGGATYILPALVEAGESSIPIMAITTDIGVAGRGRYTLTELDQRALYKPLTTYNEVIDTAEMLPRVVRRAFREATSGRCGSTHLGLPFDVQKQAVEESDVWGDPRYGQFPATRSGPDPAEVETAARLIVDARNPVFICGGGVVISGAEAALAAVAEALDAPVATTISGQGSIADDHPLAVGVVGSNGGTVETRECIAAADLVVFVSCRAGSVTTERWRYPTTGVKVVHIDADPAVIGANYPTDAALVGDARLALEALLAALPERPADPERARSVRAALADARARKRERFMALATSNETPIRPERVIASLYANTDPDTIIVADPGTPCPYFSAYYDMRTTGRTFISNRAHGALGFALPASMGAAVGRPDVKTIAVSGDGSFAMGCGELETAVRLNLPVTFITISNAVFGWIKAGQKTGFNERYYSVDFSRTDHAAVAAGFGLKTFRVTDPAELDATLKAAIEHDGPTLVDVICQPLQEAAAPVSEWVA
ncbi:thiamine pyrophosphate-binding protein [Amorphus coralli]|uniref:thiamine pyrophosphate-binding protein n=1 Tax=Amorphus coralli TaxID=340680 RepID=UPI00036042B8|nr:thiamine pyrophosphate-binding protein [Amorphus coralli]